MSIFLNNESLIITRDNDAFDLLPQVEIIQQVICSEGFVNSGMNIVAIYGGWGSGKSSVMKTIQASLDGDKTFEVDFFEAWKYEKDQNLSLSLMHFLARNFDKGEMDNFLALCGTFLKGLAKGVKVGIGDFSISVKDAIEDVESKIDEQASNKLNSYFKRQEQFELQFQAMIYSRLQISKSKKLIVFIDDLDRCEPESVLNLLSSIKNFFTLDKANRVLFVLGVDKYAVQQAITTKYGDIVKSDEYLEKIFDFKFELIGETNMKGIIEHSFPNFKKIFTRQLNEFFNFLGDHNPRRTKKKINHVRKLMLLAETVDCKYTELNKMNFDLETQENFIELIFLISLITLKVEARDSYRQMLNFGIRKNSIHEKNPNFLNMENANKTRLNKFNSAFESRVIEYTFAEVQVNLNSARRAMLKDVNKEHYLNAVKFMNFISLFLEASKYDFYPALFSRTFIRNHREEHLNIRMVEYFIDFFVDTDLKSASFSKLKIGDYFDIVDRYI